MAGLLKNQILKYLSKFTKNLSGDKLNLSTLKGEGELTNLELNEDALAEKLELPEWLRITKAVCNRVLVKIQWTKLRSQPIRLYLDEVIIETETIEDIEPARFNRFQTSQAPAGEYSSMNRIMDSIYVHVNSVQVKLNSSKFKASLQLSRVTVQSMTPTWQTPNDLKSTYIRDAGRGEILLFKEIEWQTTRIEATAVGRDDDLLTPLRLIANQAKIRIVVKKRLFDKAIISSRLTLLLDDLLWVLTITQLKEAVLFAHSLKEVIEKSAEMRKWMAAQALKKQGYIPDGSNVQQQQQQRQPTERQESTKAKNFTKFDVLSTSYHLITSRFDLHLCDDSSPDQGEEKRHWKINGGSMQITFFKLSIDYYPFHPAGGERKKWHRYADNIGSRNPWVQKLFSEFREEAVKLRRVVESSPMHSSSSAPSLLAGQPMPSSHLGATNQRNLSPSNSKSVQSSPVHGPTQGPRNSLGSRSAQASPQHTAEGSKTSTRLLESCFVFKVEDMTIYMVSMPGQKRTGPKKLLCSDKHKLHLPPEMSMLHVEFTDYFFPGGLEYPVPHSNIYVLVNPIRITLDFLTLLWSNVFLVTLFNSLDMDFAADKPKEHVDIKAEFLMPRIIALAEEKMDNQPDRPDAVQLQISKLVVSNRRTEEKMTREDLKAFLIQYKAGKLFSQTEFPNDNHHNSGEDWVPAILLDHAMARDDPYIDKTVNILLDHNPSNLKLSPSDASLQDSHPHQPHHHLPFHQLNCNSLKRLADSDIWSATADQVWLEFLGIPSSKNRPAPFLEAVPVTVWLSNMIGPRRRSDPTRACHDKGNTLNPTTGNGELHQGINASEATSVPIVTQHIFDNPCDNNGSDRPVDTRYVQQRQQDSTNQRHQDQKHQDQRHQDQRHQDQRHQDHDGNSSATSHQRYPLQEDDDKRPRKLSISGCDSNGSRVNNKKLARADSFHESDQSLPGSSSRVRPRRDDTYDREEQCSDRRRGRQSAETGVGQHQSWHRREKHREDSRSNSSPPLLATESYTRRREESRERVSKERRLRHSSSSSAEGGGGRKPGEVDGRSSGEGQVSSDSFRSAEERKTGRRTEDYCFDEERLRPKRREGSSGRSKEGRFHRSGSRERKGIYEKPVKEADRRSPRDDEDRVSPRTVQDRRSGRDRSREASERRRDIMEGPNFERSSLKSNKRDQMDGIPLSRRLSRDRDGGMSDDATDHRRRRHRSHSRGGESDSTRVTDGDHGRSRYTQDDPEYRSRLGDPARSKNSDADCDNDRFSQTSHSSLETLGRDGGQSLVADELKVGNGHKGGTTVPKPDETWDQTSKRLPPEGCKSQDDICSGSRRPGAVPETERNICVLTKIYEKLRVQLNHYQYLFLLRLSESFDAFNKDLTANLTSLASADTSTKVSTKEKSSDHPAFTMFPLMIKELEFAVVCPYQMHQRTFSDDFSNFSPFLQGLAPGQDAVFGDDGDGTCFPQLVDSIKGQRTRDDSGLRPVQSSISFKSSSSGQLENTAQPGPPADVSQRNRAFTAGSTNFVSPGGVAGPGGPTAITPADVMSQSLNSIGKDSGIGVERKPHRQQHSRGGGGGSGQRGGLGGAPDVKKPFTFTSAFSSFADKMRHTIESHDDRHSVGDDFETSSIRTDTSDDEYEHLSLDEAEEVPAFFHDPPPPEIAQTGGDTYSDNGDIVDSVSMYAESSTTKGKEMVYVVLMKLDYIEVLSETSADCSVTKVQLAKLSSIHLGNISYEDFQSRFSSSKGYLQEDIPDTLPPRYPIRIKSVVPVGPPRPTLTPDANHTIFHVDDFSLQLKMSSLTCLLDFVEDEKLPEFMPKTYDIRNFLLVLEEDRPPVNVTSPGNLPMNLHIQHLLIEKGKDGIYCFRGSPNSSPYVHTPTPTPAVPKPVLINAVTSPIMSPDGIMALLMASQNETVLLRRQLEEVRRANRLYEHQLLQCKNIQDRGAGGRQGTVAGMGRGGFTGMLRKRQSFNADSLSGSPSAGSFMDHVVGQPTDPREEVDPARDELEKENLKLQQQVMSLEDELLTVSKEKESLLQTLQLLQDELLASERKHRARSKVV